MKQILAVGLGGFIGAVSRYTLGGFVDRLIQEKLQRPLPAGTFVVNALGCLFIGALMTYLQSREYPDAVRLFLVTGILGSLTTFSTFGYDTITLLQKNELGVASGYVVANLVVGFCFVWLGMLAAKTLT